MENTYMLLACALGMIVIQPLQSIRVSSVQSLQAIIKLCQAAGVDDVGHCLHLSWSIINYLYELNSMTFHDANCTYARRVRLKKVLASHAN